MNYYCPECELIIDSTETILEGNMRVCISCGTEVYSEVPDGLKAKVSSKLEKDYLKLLDIKEAAITETRDACGCIKGMCLCMDFTLPG